MALLDLTESVDILVAGSVYETVPFTAFIHKAVTSSDDQSGAKIGEITTRYPGDRSSQDVQSLIFWDPDTKYFPFDIFHHFSGTKILHVVRPYQEMASPINGHFMGARSLERVFMTNQKFHQMGPNVFEGAIFVIWIYLEQNQIETIDPLTFNELRTLVKLSLQSNRIKSLPDKVLSTLLDLEFLNLNNNLIESLTPKMFVNNKKLKSIMLNANRIMFIPTLEITSDFDMFKLLDNLCVQMQFHNPEEMGKVYKACTIEVSVYEILELHNKQQENSENCNTNDIATVLAIGEQIKTIGAEIKQLREDTEKLTDILTALSSVHVCHSRSEHEM